MNSDNLNKGPIAGEDKGNNAKEDSWEKQAKYFQSQKDKLFEENRSLKKYEKLGEALKARPDIVEAMKEKLSTPQEAQLKRPDNFDPWEAYNDPKSESYKFRMEEMQHNINSAVQQQVEQKTSHLETQQGMERLSSELRERGLNNEQIEDFIKFADTDPSEFGIDGILKMYNAYKSNDPTLQSREIDQIKRTQSSPTVGGVLGGQAPEVPSDEDDMWKGVLGASRVGNKIP
jgi:G3E family GTPase